MMFKSRRQHPVAAITKVLEIIRGNFITILLILFVGGTGDSQTLINLTWILATIVFLLVWGIFSWLRFTYRVEEDQLVIEQGVLMRKKLYISKNRIQIIDVTAGIVQRLFGLVEVQVKTAGTSSNDAKISAVTKEVAEELREVLRKDNERQEVEELTEAERKTEIYRVSPKDLIIAASTSGRLGVALSIVGTAFSQVDQFFSEEQMIRYVESVIPSSASTSLIVSSLVFILVVSWILSFLGTLIKYSGFAITLKQDELVISHGLFERKQLTIPYNRIQAVQIKEDLLRQPLGYVMLKLDSAGYGDEGGKSVVLCPILAKDKAAAFLEKVVPEYSVKTVSTSPPAVSLRRYITRMMLIALPIALIAWFTLGMGFYPFLLLIPAVILGYAQYRDAAIGISGNSMILRYRLLSRNTVILRKHRVQTVEVSFNPFQKRSGVAHFNVTVASGKEGHKFTVRDLEQEAIGHFWEWPSEHFKRDPEERETETEETELLPAF